MEKRKNVQSKDLKHNSAFCPFVVVEVFLGVAGVGSEVGSGEGADFFVFAVG